MIFDNLKVIEQLIVSNHTLGHLFCHDKFCPTLPKFCFPLNYELTVQGKINQGFHKQFFHLANFSSDFNTMKCFGKIYQQELLYWGNEALPARLLTIYRTVPKISYQNQNSYKVKEINSYGNTYII